MANILTRMLAAVASKAAGSAAPKQGAGSMLPPQPPIKAPKGGGAAYPGYRRSIKPSTGFLPKNAFDVTNVDLVANYRSGASTVENVRNFSRFSPEMALTVSSNNRVGIPEKYTCIARNPDGSFNLDGTKLAMQILRQMNTMPDYVDGFSKVGSLQSVCEALGKSMTQEGAMMVELVLDKTRLPLSFQPIAVSTIQFEDDDKGLKPSQKVGGDYIDLDLPTVFWVSVDPSLYDAYPQSPMEPAMQPVLAAQTFLTDLRRICARHAYPRYEIILNEEIIKKKTPPDVLADPDKLGAYYDELFGIAESAINNLGVEEAIAHFDFFTVEILEVNGTDASNTFNTVNTIHGGKLATALKTPPSVLGMGATSQNLSNTETLMYMLHVNGMIRRKLNELLSKAMTLAVRLFGLDVTVEFEFDDIDLRPQSELEAYKSMKQSRILTQLSFGLISDEEACLKLTGQLPPPGYKPLTGTMFPVVPAPQIQDNGNNTSTTGATGAANTPAAAKGSTKGSKK
jgi:hypothetical protein